MFAPAEPFVETLRELFRDERENVVIYADHEGETVLYEGSVTIRASGWVELSDGRLLSPNAIDYIDDEP